VVFGTVDFTGFPTSQNLTLDSQYNFEDMSEKLFIVYLTGAPDPMDLAYQQPVRASSVDVSEDAISFFTQGGSLAAYFDKSVVRSWREANESELLPS
jgi:hypothetical protein